MKVGIFLRDYLPEDGGRYTFSNEITNALLKLSTQCSHQFVVFGTNKEPPPALLLSDSIQYVYVCSTYKQTVEHKISTTIIDFLKKLQHPLMSFSINPRQQMLVLDALSSNGIDILWEPGPNCLTMDLPYIITVWDLEHRVLPYFPEIDRECKWDLLEQHYATKLRRASFVITNTKAGKAQIEMFYQVPTERIKILPFPVPNFVSSAIPSTRNNIFAKYNLSDKYLFYPAQFWPLKNHVNLLLAVQSLKHKYDLNFPVVFCGSDKGNKVYVSRMVAELDLSNQIKFLGFVPQEDLCSLYRNAFALTYVTFNGPGSLPPLEAFALGCPVIASKNLSEQLGNAALLVNPKQPEEIASAIKLLWEDHSLRQCLVERGFARASKWTCEDYVKGIFALLDEFVFIRRCWDLAWIFHKEQQHGTF
jgi:glycosyltransferase involved in cell wall biosynthesis